MPRSVVHSRRLSSRDDPVPVLEDLLNCAGGLPGDLGPGDLVLIKPNFVAPLPRATTDFTFIEFFATRIREAGAVPIVGESSGYEFDTNKTFEILGIGPYLAERGIEIVNFEEHGYAPVDLGRGMPVVDVAEPALRAKWIVNLPVLKGHTITKVTGAVKNLFGMLSLDSRRRLHVRGLHAGIAAVARHFANALHVVDARDLLTRAVFGETRPLDYCLAGTDPFALDHFGSGLLAIDAGAVRHLGRVPEYDVRGAAPPACADLSTATTPKQRLHRLLYSAFYWLDGVKCGTVGGKSIIPHLHWTLGVHPALGDVTDAELRELAALCPVEAISVERRSIIKERCVAVRCLKCYREGPPGSIRLGGLNPPRRRSAR